MTLYERFKMSSKWELRGNSLVSDLSGVTQESDIESLALEVVNEIIRAYPDKVNSRKIPLTTVRKIVLSTYPDTPEQIGEYQYFTKSGKGNVPRYQHLALKHLTLPKEDWDSLGDEKRDEYLGVRTETETIKLLTINDMNIEQLELDTDTQNSVITALNTSGKSLSEFIKQACKVYANTINGKHKNAELNLSTVLTSELLDSEVAQYKTHPKKIEELTKRAIKAITMHNDNCTEINQKWFLSATAINGLTGSRIQAVTEILNNYRELINTHNNKHGLTPYINRGTKRRIEDDINLISLVPDGMTLI